MTKKGIVYLIGAGPGDPGLFTLKGKKFLARSEVIVYDYLVNPELLVFAREGAEIIYVGKKRGHKEIPQKEINRLITKQALEGKIVARLKGGDPFIFGRGGEEAVELAKHGIPFDVIPGVSSPTGVTAYAGIPLTHRDYSSSFAVVTGHEDPKKLKTSLPWEALAKIGTLVFLMGVEKLEQNMKKLIEMGKSPKTPAAIITWGTLPNQSTLTGTIGTIVSLSKEKKISSPSIIAVGDVVNLRKNINWFESKPLFGKTVLVTRARPQSRIFAELLEEEGGQVIEFPTIDVVPIRTWNRIDKAVEKLGHYNWLIFTSVNGVNFFFQRLRRKKTDVRELKGIRIAAIGEQTENEINKMGINVDLIPEEFRAEGLIKLFERIDIKGSRILIPRAKIARKILPMKLRKMGARVDVLPVYETKMPGKLKIDKVRKLLLNGYIDVITFTSSSTVKNFFSMIGRDKEIISRSTIACIGPITAETIRGFGIEPEIISGTYTVQGLTREIASYFTGKQQSKN
jgi:uroporphyrinogen III methyltransferase/synthase